MFRVFLTKRIRRVSCSHFCGDPLDGRALQHYNAALRSPCSVQPMVIRCSPAFSPAVGAANELKRAIELTLVRCFPACFCSFGGPFLLRNEITTTFYVSCNPRSLIGEWASGWTAELLKSNEFWSLPESC